MFIFGLSSNIGNSTLAYGRIKFGEESCSAAAPTH